MKEERSPLTVGSLRVVQQLVFVVAGIVLAGVFSWGLFLLAYSIGRMGLIVFLVFCFTSIAVIVARSRRDGAHTDWYEVR